jgi:hypothetical protein
MEDMLKELKKFTIPDDTLFDIWLLYKLQGTTLGAGGISAEFVVEKDIPRLKRFVLGNSKYRNNVELPNNVTH